MVKVEEIKSDLRNPDIGYIHYSVAKRESIRQGVEFDVEELGRFIAVDYIGWRPDINSRFSGFSVKEIKN